jgi:copper chaperone
MCTNDTINDLGLTDKNSSCSCGSQPDHSDESAAIITDAVTTEYSVAGMTGGHCVSSVTEELSSLDGVTGVNVELHSGGNSRVVVASSTALDLEAIRAAVEEAGYELADSVR